MSHVLHRLLGENIANVADGRFAIAQERASIMHMSIPRRLDNLKGRLLHTVFEMMTIRIKVDMAEIVD